MENTKETDLVNMVKHGDLGNSFISERSLKVQVNSKLGEGCRSRPVSSFAGEPERLLGPGQPHHLQLNLKVPELVGW